MTALLTVPPINSYQTAQTPRYVPMFTTDSYATITTAGYLNKVFGSDQLTTSDLVFAKYATNTLGIFTVAIASDKTITLNAWISEGDVSLPVVAGDFAMFDGTTGRIKDTGISPSNAAKTVAVMANGAVTLNHIAQFADTAGTVKDGGVLGTAAAAAISSAVATVAGVSGATVVGDIATFSDTSGTITDTSNTVTDYQEFVGLTNIVLKTAGTWTLTRVAEANYSLVHTAAADTSIICYDITPQLRAAASKGFKLASVDIIYSIGTLALTAHTLTLDSIAYANNVANAVTSVPLTGTLATATQANPYVTNIAVTTPAFFNTACAKYALELTVNAQATSAYSLFGINLHFSKTIV